MAGSDSDAARGLVYATSPADGVKVTALNRPEKRNALSRQLISDFLGHLAVASADPGVRAIIVSGNGPFFSAGADLNDIAALDPTDARACRYLEDLCRGMAAVRKPVIAAVNGPALGGGFELALMCDLIIAAKTAYFALPETARGLIPGAGGTQRLTAALGKYCVMRAVLLGRPITSDEALSCGLLCDQTEDGDTQREAISVATELAARGADALQLAKEAISRGPTASVATTPSRRHLYYATFGTADKRRGVDEFLARRTKIGSDGSRTAGAADTAGA